MSHEGVIDDFVEARKWILAFFVIGLLAGIAVLLIGYPVADYLARPTIPAVAWERAIRFWQLCLNHPARVVKFYYNWTMQTISRQQLLPSPIIAAMIVVCLALVEGIRTCPYDFRHTHQGRSRRARMSDLRRWAQSRVIGWLVLPSFLLPGILRARRATNLLDKCGIILGKFGKRFLRCGDTLTCLVLAAPGSGKTAGVMIPTLLADGNEDWSMFIYDIKGELYEETAGHRAKFGPVFRFNPMGRDGCRWNPLSPEKSLPRGKRFILARAELDTHLATLFGDDRAAVISARVSLLNLMRDNVHWRREIMGNPNIIAEPKVPIEKVRDVFRNKIAPLAQELSHIGSEIESYLGILAANMVPPPKGGGGNEEHFATTGRDALFGMMGFTIFRAIERGIEPHLGLLGDWWSSDSINLRNSEEDTKEGEDGTSKTLDLWIDECDACGYPLRYKQSLGSLRAKPDRERGSVVSTAEKALNIYKMATVRDATCTSDFSLDDIRGMMGPDGKNYPVSIYIVVSLEQITPMAPLLCMLTDALQMRLISQPAKIAKKSRRVMFCLDEFAQIPKMESLLRSPAVGRGQKVGNLLLAQSEGQIEETYGQAGLKTLMDTSEWKILFALTDKHTAEKFSTAIGNTTQKQKSTSGHGIDFGGAVEAMLTSKGGSSQQPGFNESWQGRPLLSPSDLMTTDDGSAILTSEQVVLARGRFSRPIIARTPYYFEDKKMLARSKITPPPATEAKGFCGPLSHFSPITTTEDPFSPPAGGG